MSLPTKTPGADEPGANIVLSKQRQFTFPPLVRQAAGGLLLLAVVAAGASIAYRTCRASRGTMSPALVNPALVLQNTKSEAVATPTDKRGFVTFDIQSGAGVPSVKDGFRAGWGYPQGCPHGFGRVLNIPPTNDRFKTGAGGFLHVPEGA